MKRVVIAAFVFSLATAALAESPPGNSHGTTSSALGTVESRSVVFHYDNTYPYDRANLYGFNHAPSVTRLDGDRLLAAWFSGPFEASIHQVILGAESDDGGRFLYFDRAALIDVQPFVAQPHSIVVARVRRRRRFLVGTLDPGGDRSA